jgi:hypothetical protein
MTQRRRAASGAIAGIAMIVPVVAASVVTLGAPDLGLAGGFLEGSYPSVASAVALCSVICYAVVAVVATATLVEALRSGAAMPGRGRSLRAAALIVVGAVLLAVSLVARAQAGAGICCGGGPRQIHEAATLVR